jgi:hypothetical protein
MPLSRRDFAPRTKTNPISDSGSIYSVGQTCPILWAFDNAGDGGNILYAPWPRPAKPVIIQTDAVSLGTFVPEHVRPQGPYDANGNPTPPSIWANQMARIQAPPSLLGIRSASKNLFSTDGFGNDSTNQYFATNIRFVGVELTYQPYPSANYLQDPPPGNALISASMGSSGIIFDRCWIHGYAAPFRVYKGLQWDGQSQAIIDSYVNNMHFPRQINLGYQSAANDYGLLTSKNVKTVTISSGQSQFGATPYDQPNDISFTVSGASASGSYERLHVLGFPREAQYYSSARCEWHVQRWSVPDLHNR